MDHEDQLMYRLNKPAVMSCSSGHINVDPIDICTHNNSTTTGSMFRGPVLLLDDHDHGHGHGHDKTKVPDHLDHLMKAQIANHPSYPGLLAAYIQCQKVGAPPEKALLLEEIGATTTTTTTASSSDIGADPELDCFMESYCEVLQRFKEELTKPLNEATMFLSSLESQLSTLNQANFTKTFEHYDDHQARGTAISDHDHHHDSDHDEEDMNNNMVMMGSSTSYDQDHHHQQQVVNNNNERVVMTSGGCEGSDDHHEQLKEKLLRKYSGYLAMLKTEFLKKRKKVELPKTARSSLLRWWNAHSRWPYPTEEEKVKLSEETGLDQKQINNWFVNQRKRHWKPSEDIKSALVNDLATK